MRQQDEEHEQEERELDGRKEGEVSLEEGSCSKTTYREHRFALSLSPSHIIASVVSAATFDKQLFAAASGFKGLYWEQDLHGSRRRA